jgi:hypothetical protein
VWVSDPSGTPWEVYTVLADAPETGVGDDTTCCGRETAAAARATTPACC